MYVGRFEKGKCNGKGVHTLANGNVYKGNFRNGKYHGYGVYKLKNGDIYEGMFANHNYHGEGLLTDSKGKRTLGVWKEGKLISVIGAVKKVTPAI